MFKIHIVLLWMLLRKFYFQGKTIVAIMVVCNVLSILCDLEILQVHKDILMFQSVESTVLLTTYPEFY